MTAEFARVERALPNYKIADVVGRGGFGLVLAGDHRHLNRPVAVKMLTADPHDDEGRRRFLDEARLLESLSHPHIVRLYDYVESGDLRLLVMERLGETLRSKARAGLTADVVVAVGLAVADALESAHRRGVLHRDIKPDNVLFADDGRPKVTDFGIAKIVETTMVNTNTLIGTPLYMAPEQFTHGPLGPGSDLYSLGIVLHELFSGTTPFSRGLGFAALQAHHADVEPPPLTHAPPAIAALVRRAMEKKLADRPTSARAFAVALAAAAADAFGPDWLNRCTLPLMVDDEVREAARGGTAAPGQPAPSVSPAPNPSAPDQPTLSTAKTVSWMDYAARPPEAPSPAPAPAPSPAPTWPPPRPRPRFPGPPPGGPPPSPYPSPGSFPTPSPSPPPSPPPSPSPPPAPSPAPGSFPPFPPTPHSSPPLAPTRRVPEPSSPRGGRRARRQSADSGRTGFVVTHPYGLAGGPDGSLYISQPLLHQVSRITAQGQLVQFAGTGKAGFSGDGGRREAAELNLPYGIAVDAAGAVYLADHFNNRVRRIGPEGWVATVAGHGSPGSALGKGTRRRATQVPVNAPRAVAVDPLGGVYVTSTDSHQVLRVDPQGFAELVAGSGVPGFRGDGQAATDASLNQPGDVAVVAGGPAVGGGLVVADTGNRRVRYVGPDGLISSIAGSPMGRGLPPGGSAPSGVLGRADQVDLGRPSAVAVAPSGSLFVADASTHRIYELTPDGLVRVAAGTGVPGHAPDGAVASTASLDSPRGMFVGPDGSVYVAEQGRHRIRVLTRNGTIVTLGA